MLAISITVGGTERINQIEFDSVRKIDNLNSEVDTMD